jgi:hypothetical protein
MDRLQVIAANAALVTAKTSARILGAIVNHSGPVGQAYLAAAGIDVEGLRDPVPAPEPPRAPASGRSPGFPEVQNGEPGSQAAA